MKMGAKKPPKRTVLQNAYGMAFKGALHSAHSDSGKTVKTWCTD